MESTGLISENRFLAILVCGGGRGGDMVMLGFPTNSVQREMIFTGGESQMPCDVWG